MIPKKQNLLIISCIAAITLFMAACDEKELLPPANTNAYISFINTSVFLGNNAPAVRATVTTNEKADTNALLLTYNYIYPEPNKYLPFLQGNCSIAFKDSSRNPLVTGGTTTLAGAYYSAILADSMHTYTAVIVQDDYKVVAGKALIRVLHFSPDAGEVALYRDTTKLDNFGALHFKQVTPYTPVEPGSNFSFIIRKNDGSNQRVARYFTSSLLAGAAYTILLKGYVQPPDGDVANKNSQIVFYRN